MKWIHTDAFPSRSLTQSLIPSVIMWKGIMEKSIFLPNISNCQIIKGYPRPFRLSSGYTAWLLLFTNWVSSLSCVTVYIIISVSFCNHKQNLHTKIVISSPYDTSYSYRFQALSQRHTWHIKSPLTGMSDIGDEIRRYSSSVPVSTIFYAHHCK